MSDKIIDITTQKPYKIDVVKGLSYDDITQDDLSGGVWTSEIQAFLESQNLKALFYSEDWVFITLDLVSDYVSRSPMVVIKESTGADGKQDEEIIKSHPVLTILENPNEFQGYSQWIYNYCVELDLMGNTIVYYAQQKQNLFIIPAETVVLDFDEKGKHAGYTVSSEGTNPFHLQTDGVMKFKKNQIWHQRRPNPKSMLWGLSPFIPNRKNILFNRYSGDWLNSFYQKGAMPTVALSMDRAVDEKSAMRFLRSFEMAHTGRRNMRRSLVLPKGVSVEALSIPISDQMLPELVRMNRENILNILRVPKHAVSLAETGSLGSQEAKQALKFFYETAIIPKQNKIEDHLTRKFREAELLGEDEWLQFDNSNVEVLREDMVAKADLAQKLAGIWTPNEIRESLWSMEPIDGGNSIISIGPQLNRPFGFTQESIELEPQQEPEQQSLAEIEDEEPIDDLVDDKAIDEDDLMPQSKEYREGVIKTVIEKHTEHLKFMAKQNLEIIETVDEKAQKFIKDLFAKWAKLAMEVVEKELKKSPARQKALGDDDVPLKIPSKRRLKKLLENALDESNSDYLDFFTDSFNQVVNDAYDIQTNIVPDGDNKEAIAALKDENEKGRKRMLETRGITSFANIKQTQTDAIMKEVETGVENKTPLRDIGTSIAKRFENISQGKAETIARTEALTAVSIGKQAALKDTVKIIPDMVKVWINLGDLRVRGNPGGLYPDSKADHWVLQGETKEINEPFSNDLMYPRDVKGPPGQTINCRCDILMVPREDLESLQP